jgi:protein-tyrosine phosphatase
MIHVNNRRKAGGALHEWKPNFHWLTDDLAVGGFFPSGQTRHLATVHGIAAVVDLREEDCDDQALLNKHGIAFLHLPTPDLHPATVDHLDIGVTFVGTHLDAGRRVLIHCQHGIGRSALLALCVLVDRGYEPMDALRLAKDKRELVSPSERQYEGWVGWLRRSGRQAPDYHSFGCVAYRHLAQN